MLVICSSNSLRLILENVDFLGVWQCKFKVFFGVSGVGVGGGGWGQVIFSSFSLI